jgi:hypothetical protein
MATNYENDPLFRTMALAADVEHFISHDSVGQYLMARAIQDRADALEGLAEVNAINAEAVIELQWKARVPQLFMAWLNEALANGVAAEQLDAAESEGYR